VAAAGLGRAAAAAKRRPPVAVIPQLLAAATARLLAAVAMQRLPAEARDQRGCRQTVPVAPPVAAAVGVTYWR
jgi:hypothetical protein